MRLEPKQDLAVIENSQFFDNLARQGKRCQAIRRPNGAFGKRPALRGEFVAMR